MQAPYLDFLDPDFSTRSEAVRAARAASWYARTPFGIAVLRHREVGLLLRDKRLRQGSHAWPQHTGLQGSFADFWTNSVIAKEGPDHQNLRRIAQAGLHQTAIEALAPAFTNIAETLLDGLAGRQTIELMGDFTTPFAGQAICTLLGLPRQDWRRVAEDATRLGLAMGVAAKQHEATVNAATDRLMALAEELLHRDSGAPDTFVGRLVEARGEASDDELLNLIVISIFGGVDTTRAQLGFGMALFIDHPAQWQAFKADAALIPATVEEFIRARPTTTWATREAVEDVEIGGRRINAGTVLHLLVHASARDPEICEDPRFDITRPRKRHFGFGGGAHHCIGHFVARTDLAAALTALQETFATVEYDGDPEWMPDSGNTGPIRLPIRYEVAA